MNPDYAEMLSVLFAENAEFLVVGAFAMAAYGTPRATASTFGSIPTANAERLWRALLRFGAPLADRSPDDFANRDVVLQMGVSPARIDVFDLY